MTHSVTTTAAEYALPRDLTGFSPTAAIAADDFNGDGLTDLVFALTGGPRWCASRSETAPSTPA